MPSFLSLLLKTNLRFFFTGTVLRPMASLRTLLIQMNIAFFPSFLLNFYFKMVKKVAVGKNKGLTA